MISKREEISRGGGSVRVGSIGTISSLMSRELESSSSRRNPQSEAKGDSTFKLRKSMDETQKGGTRGSIKQKSPENIRRDRISVLATPKRQKQKASPEEARRNRDGSSRRSPDSKWKTRNQKRTHHIPMLGSEDTALDKTPKRDKSGWKVSIVEVVDTKCGIPAGPFSSRLKKLGFSKLSQSII